MINFNEIKIMVAPRKNIKIFIPNYLIEKISNHLFHIHRELTTNEIFAYDQTSIFLYKNKKF